MTAVSSPARTAARGRAQRYWEIDTLRGVAIVMMIIYHLMWDLWFYRVLPNIVLYEGFWKYFQRTIAVLFIGLVGVSLAVTAMRMAGPHGDQPVPFRHYLLRGLKIFGWGIVVSLVMWAARVGYVHFGVLHLIGFSIIAAYPLLRLRWINLALWAAFNIAGYLLLGVTVSFPWLLWLGLPPAAYYPNDYFPVIPWFGVVLLGIFLGNTLYTPKGRVFSPPPIGDWLPLRGLQWLGRHSLIIYLLHQIALFAILAALGIVRL